MSKKIDFKEFLYITFGGLLVAVSVYFFMIPGNFATGSLSGLVLVLSNFIPMPISVMTFILNTVLLIVGFIFIGKEFGVKTIYASNLLPLFLWIFEKTFPNQKSLTGDVILDALCTVLVASAGLAILFNCNASSGGLDIVAMIMNKYLHIELGKSVTIAGVLTVLSSLTVYDSKTFIVSVLATYFMGGCIDSFISGFHVRKRVSIISDNYNEIQQYIIGTLNRGCSLYDMTGGFAGKKKIELQVILTQAEYGQLIAFLNEAGYPAFVVVSNVGEIIGEWSGGAKKIKEK